MERKYFVGNKVKLMRECLGNSAGTIGVCYEEYDIGYGPGASFIFQNGRYDGFGADEQEVFLAPAGHEPACAGYEFQNVIKLEQDFRQGRFDPALKGDVS